MRRAVFLDRDGVLNRARVRNGKPYPPSSIDEVEIFPDARAALERLQAVGFLIIVVTNQPDVAAGKQRREVVEAINGYLCDYLPIDVVKVCYHLDEQGCECRKPKPGMLLQSASELGIDLAQSYLIGDRWRDVAAAQAVGCQAYFIDWGYSEKRPSEPYVAVKSLREAADQILR